MAPEKFDGIITVASRIVDQLSSGLYESPAACLKELINNSYDADARRVDVFIKPDADRIIIEDNGVGMSRADFEKHFKRISESYKREAGDTTKLGRKKIGKIGIGFIAANEICDTMELYSQKAGSRQLLHVQIHFDRMRKDPALRRRDGGDIEKADYSGEVLDAEPRSGYTQLILKQVRPGAKLLFAGETNRRIEIRRDEGKGDVETKTLYGLRSESVARILGEEDIASWAEFDSYSQNLLRVGLNVPVEYADDWLPSNLHRQVNDFEREVTKLKFQVVYDGTELRKPIILRPPAGKSALVSRFDFRGKYVSATGYFYAQHGQVRPKELHGLLIRIRQAAVGGYDPSFLEFPPSEGSLIQRWISAEVWADDRLEEALNIDRKTLRVSHPAYVEFQRAVHSHLAKVISTARERLYDTASQVRTKQKVEAAVEELREFATVRLEPIDQETAKKVVSTFTRQKGKSAKDGVLRKFSVLQLYEVVLEVAEEVLEPGQLRRFVKALTDRLAK